MRFAPVTRRKAILLEANEVPFRVLDDYAAAHRGSSLARLLEGSRQYVTRTRDTVLSPWVTWPTVHRGVTDTCHQLHHFGQDLTRANREYPPIWEILAGRGIATGVFGSLHSHPLPSDLKHFSYYMPDTFAPDPDSFPKDLSCFQDFNLSMARESPRNVSRKVPLAKSLSVLTRHARLGLRWETLADVFRQVVDERLHPWKRVRRRTYQSVLGFDVFMHLLKTRQPGFTTFFTNHVASAMHRYWAARYPGHFETLGYDEAWIRLYRREIDFAMGKLDAALRELMAFVHARDEYVLVAASSMGQAAADSEPLKSQLYLVDAPSFMARLGVPASDWSLRPAMAPTVSVYVNPPALEAFRRSLSRLSVNGRALAYEERERGFFSLVFGHRNLPDRDIRVSLAGAPVEPRELGLSNVRVEDESNSTGYHVPEGSLLIYDPRRPVSERSRACVDTTRIAPTILEILGVARPRYWSEPVPSGPELAASPCATPS